jgi:hypothetical protein
MDHDFIELHNLDERRVYHVFAVVGQLFFYLFDLILGLFFDRRRHADYIFGHTHIVEVHLKNVCIAENQSVREFL